MVILSIMLAPEFIDETFIKQYTDFNQLIELLASGFKKNEIMVPARHHHQMTDGNQSTDNTLLLMPAWDAGHHTGVKLITINPDNNTMNLPAIQGTYILFDGKNGTLKAIIEAKSLTTKRTAATSALASKHLSKPDASSLLMVGTGALAPDLIEAHCSVRSIKKVFIWGRNHTKAVDLSKKLINDGIAVKAIEDLDQIVPEVDIISCATLSKLPLIKGKLLRPGQHLDLVGSYTPEARESDDEVIMKASIYVDHRQGALTEAGDIVDPIKRGLIHQNDIIADLFDLAFKDKFKRKSDASITVFKSVGHALEDLVAAGYYYDQFNR